jgi:hypothetical protein
MLIPLDADGLFVVPKKPTFLKYEQLGKNPPRCHQCVDMLATGECWVVDCGNWCVWRMALRGSGSDISWEVAGKEDVSAGYAARQIVVSPDGEWALKPRLMVSSSSLLSPRRILLGQSSRPDRRGRQAARVDAEHAAPSPCRRHGKPQGATIH